MSASAVQEAPPQRRRRRWSVAEGIRPYDRRWFAQDVVAGVTLAALAIPEVMGYTKIAGTPVVTGLYTMLFPVVAYALFGSSRRLVVGGDSATAAIMYAGIAGLGIAGVAPNSPEWLGLASLSALVAGAFLFLARLARLAFLADFLSRTVLVGFLTGVGIQVAMGQVGGMLGIPAPHVPATELSGAIRSFALTLGHIGDASWQTALVAAAVIAVLVLLGGRLRRVPAGLVAVIGAIVVSWAADLEAHGVAILGKVPSGLPHVGLPQGVTWSDASRLLTISASLFLVILAQSAATSRAYAVKHSESVDEGTDLVGLGLANVGAGFSGTFVVNGSPTKTAMADDGGSHSQVAQLTAAAVVAIVLLFLTKPLQYLPNAALSAIVFVIGLKLVDLRQLREISRMRTDEFVVALLTALVVVGVGVEQGIVLAILLSLVLHVRRHYAPADVVVTWDARGHLRTTPPAPGMRTRPGLVVYRFGVGIFYANAQHLTNEVLELTEGDDPPRWFILDCSSVDDVDYTGGKTLLELAAQVEKLGAVFALADVRDPVRRELDRYGLTAAIGPDRVYESVQSAIAVFERADGRPETATRPGP